MGVNDLRLNNECSAPDVRPLKKTATCRPRCHVLARASQKIKYGARLCFVFSEAAFKLFASFNHLFLRNSRDLFLECLVSIFPQRPRLNRDRVSASFDVATVRMLPVKLHSASCTKPVP